MEIRPKRGKTFLVASFAHQSHLNEQCECKKRQEWTGNSMTHSLLCNISIGSYLWHYYSPNMQPQTLVSLSCFYTFKTAYIRLPCKPKSSHALIRTIPLKINNEKKLWRDERITKWTTLRSEPRKQSLEPIEPLEVREVNHGALVPSHEPYSRFTPPFIGEVRP
jgi:hypothetical protein